MDRDEARRRFAEARIARLATVDPAGRPHLVPVVFVVIGETVYSAVDTKPKTTNSLRRIENVRAHPAVGVLVDHYDDADWSALWWARADGTGRVLEKSDAEAVRAVDALARKYVQHRADRPPGPVLAIDVERWSGWATS